MPVAVALSLLPQVHDAQAADLVHQATTKPLEHGQLLGRRVVMAAAVLQLPLQRPSRPGHQRLAAVRQLSLIQLLPEGSDVIVDDLLRILDLFTPELILPVDVDLDRGLVQVDEPGVLGPPQSPRRAVPPGRR